MLSFLQSENKKIKKISVLPGHLLALEHAAAQEFFPLDQAGVLEAFVSRLVCVPVATKTYHLTYFKDDPY